MKLRILIVDDHPVVRESLRFVFAAAGIEQTLEATTCRDAIAAMREHSVDLVLLDVALSDRAPSDRTLSDRALSDRNGLDALQKITTFDTPVPVLVHSYYNNPRLLSRSFHAGAAGYLVKGQDKNALLDAMRQAAAGGSVWTTAQMDQIRMADAELDPLDLARPLSIEVESRQSV